MGIGSLTESFSFIFIQNNKNDQKFKSSQVKDLNDILAPMSKADCFWQNKFLLLVSGVRPVSPCLDPPLCVRTPQN